MALLLQHTPTAGLVLIALFIWLAIRSYTTPKITRNGERLRIPPNTLPLVGNGILFLRPRQQLFDWFSRCERRFGRETLQITVPSLPPGVIIADPDNLAYVLKHDALFQKGAFFTTRSWDLFGHGIINVDGELWRVQRRAGLQFLGAANLRVLTAVALPQYIEQSIAVLERVAGAGEVVDLQAVVHEITTQLMGRMAYNMEMHADEEFTTAFEYASGKTAERFQNPLWFFTELITGQKLRNALRTVRQYGARIVASAVEDRKIGATQSSSNSVDALSGSLIQSLLDAIGDQKLVADAALNYLSAGRDTVAQALAWTFYQLIQHPDITTTLLTAVNLLGDPENPETLTPTALPYALAVFNESLRLFPPVPFEIKQAQQPVTLPDGTHLPPGAVVVWCAWAMNRSHATWGADADAFRPERWLVSGGEGVLRPSAAEFPVFNGGPRLCLGKAMAELVGVQVLARLVRRFEFEAAWEGERRSGSSLTLPMEAGLPVRVRRRAVS